MCFKKIGGLFFVFMSAITVHSQDRQPAFEMNARLGRGINMGNTFEAPSESEWGNPWKPEYFKVIATLGFNHVRLPVRWEPSARSLDVAPYTINADFLKRIQQVVDTALKHNLHIIVNMHHHEALFDDPAGQKQRFLEQWRQISEHFKDYPDRLLFEVLNEPHGNITPAIWNEYFADALSVIRETNPTRVVLMGVAEYGGLGAISQLQLPDDDYIIVSPHYYNPFNFTHQGAEWVGPQADEWLGTEWRDTEADRETVASEFSYALQFSGENNIPIHVGEFGAYGTADMASRERWTTFLARWFEEKGLSWAYWEFSAGFGIFDPATEQLRTPLVDALLHNEMPAPTPIVAVPVYVSNFNNGTDGWSLTTQAGASGSLTNTAGALNVAITSVGAEGWHMQLVRNNIRLEHEKLYRISFKAQATSDRSATFYAGKASDPWNAYSGYNGFSIGTLLSSFTYSFTMTAPTDPAARLVFDLGTNAAGLKIVEIRVDELRFIVTDAESTVQKKINLYPNPVTTVIVSEDFLRFEKAALFDTKGVLHETYQLHPNTQQIDLTLVPQGFYILHLSGPHGDARIRLVKK